MTRRQGWLRWQDWAVLAAGVLVLFGVGAWVAWMAATL